MKSKYTLVPLIILLLIAGTGLGRGQHSGLLKKTGAQSAVSSALTSSIEWSTNGKRTLRVIADNPRYFTGGSGKAVLLSGFEFWDVLRFDGKQNLESKSWSDFLNISRSNGINFIRLWIWNELTQF